MVKQQRVQENFDGWALVLGASSGFGAAASVALAQEGLRIFGVHLDRKSTLHIAQETQRKIEATGAPVEFFNVNAASEEKRALVIAHIRERLKNQKRKHLSVFMHSLAFGTLMPLIPTKEENLRIEQRQIEMTIDIMANSLVYWTQDLVAAGLIGEGSRVFAMTSEGSRRVIPRYGPVSAAKSVLESHVRQLAYELAPMGATVNAILAGVTDTPSLRKIPNYELLIEAAAKRNPQGRLTTPEDVASAIVALSSGNCHWITGNTICIDGGEHICG